MSLGLKKVGQAVQQWWIVSIPFLVIFPLLRVSTMMYDGWAGPYYYQNNGGLLNWFFYVLGPMRQWINGRVSSNLFSGILESFTSELPLDLICALVIAGILYCFFVLFPTKNKLAVSLLYTTMIVFMPYQARIYVVQIALLQYLTPILFILVALHLFESYVQTCKTSTLIQLYFLCAVACSWMENTSVAYGVVLSCCCLFHTLKMKKIDLRLWGSVGISVVSGLFMVLSPGMFSSRIAIPDAEPFLVFGKTRLLEHLKVIFEKLIATGAMAHFILAAVLCIVSLRASLSSTGRFRVFRLLLCIANLGVALVFFFLGMATGEFQYTVSINLPLIRRISENNCLLIFGLTLYAGWLTANLLLLCRPQKNILYLCLYGIVLLVSVFPTNQNGVRIDAPAYLILILLSCFWLSRFPTPENRTHSSIVCSIVLAFGFVLCLDFQSQLCLRISTVQKERDARIEWIRSAQLLGTADSEHIFTIPLFNERDVCRQGATTEGTFHYPSFLLRHGLASDTRLFFSNNEDIVLDQYAVAEDGLTVNFHCRLSDIDSYSYIISYTTEEMGPDGEISYVDFDKIEGVTSSVYTAEASRGSGNYQLTIIAVSADGLPRSVLQIPWTQPDFSKST